MKLEQTIGYKTIKQWLERKKYTPFAFQQQAWQHIIHEESGLVNAPTGCGKTFAVFLGSVIQFINEYPEEFTSKKNNGLQLLWITPLRALAKDISRAMEEVIAELGLQWRTGIRNGDTVTAERQKQKRNMPEVLIITPESLHLLLAQKEYPEVFKTLRIIAVDEWHELIGSKRGVQVELAVSRIVNCQRSINNGPSAKYKRVCIWGISATIGNLAEAKEVLLAPLKKEGIIIRAKINKPIQVESIIPDEIEKYPWAGHLGIKLADKLIPIIEQSKTTLIFINTRGMSERWYQTLLDIAPELAGAIALHHGSIEQELRLWVEDSLHTEKLKAVVCTSSLDLGVDFRPVDTVIQVGSPKGVARFLQRAGRSGHRPGEISKIYFLPTHSLELLEVAALKQAIKEEAVESRQPMVLCFDVLLQFLCTLAISDGFEPDQLYSEIKSTYCYADITPEEWQEILFHLTQGGKALQQYDEYKKVEVEGGICRITNRRIAMRHRMHIGTIVSDAMLKVKLMSGGYIGVIEEWFISRLDPGDVFTLAGRNLELVMIKDMSVMVRKSSSKKSIVPSWMGGRMSLTANLGHILRQTFNKALVDEKEKELKSLHTLFLLQQQLSHIPRDNELLVEQIEDRNGYHLLVYPFEGRQVHEAMSAILAYRIGQLTPITFSISMNDYGFELLSDQPVPVDDSNVKELFTTGNLILDIQKSMNSTEMARRKFRDIAVIGGLIFQGMPGEKKKARHLQSSASLLFKVFEEYDPNNILLRQAYHEVLTQQMDEARLRDALTRISNSNIIVTFPARLTPLSFPIIVDGLSRINLSSEKLEDRVKKMQMQLERL
jgi:ATP-dependent Lhr-like helicase